MNEFPKFYHSQKYVNDQYRAIIPASELANMSFSKTNFLIDGLLSEGLCLLAGPPKIGKNFLCLSFINQIINSGQTVYYFSFEDDDRRICSRLSHLNLLSEKIHIHCGREGVLAATEPEEFNLFQTIAHNDETALIVLDTMERVLPQTKGKRDYHYYVKSLDAWAKLALQSNTCILMVHHTRKGDGTPEHSPQNAILGSVGIAATFDTNMIMERDRNGNYALHVEGKDVFQRSFKLSKEGVKFSWEEKSPLDSLGDAQRQVLLFIEQNVGCTQSEIVSKLEKSKPQVSQIVSKLCTEGFLRKEESKLFKNTPY